VAGGYVDKETVVQQGDWEVLRVIKSPTSQNPPQSPATPSIPLILRTTKKGLTRLLGEA